MAPFFEKSAARDEHTVPDVAGSESGDVRPGGGSETGSGDVRAAAEPLPGVSEDREDGSALIAVVMDDCGLSMELARQAVSLDLPITWSILPKLAYSSQTAELLDENDIPYLVHVPMQAQADPDGRAGGGLYEIGVGMEGEEIAAAMSRMIDSLPGAFGVNNHRGSRATEDQPTMEAVCDELAERGMFFLDSSTSRRTVAYGVARAKGLRTLKNGHFLDNEPDCDKIAEEMEFAIKLARRNGYVVVICHLRPETVAFLAELSRWDLASEGVRLVTLPQLLASRR